MIRAREHMTKTADPISIALRFNECISGQDLHGLALLMTEDHTFIDREGTIHQPKQVMIEGWTRFFRMYPHYRNTFVQLGSRDNLAIILGYAYWSADNPHDPAIWTATIVDDLIQEWHIYPDTEANRRCFGLL